MVGLGHARESAHDAAPNARLGQNADGRLEVFGATAGSGIWHIWQTAPNNDWSGWTLLGAADASSVDLALGQNVDGRLELVVVSSNNTVLHAWQVTPNGAWSDWSPLPNGDRSGLRLSVGRNADGRLETFLVDTANNTWHNWQIAPGGDWSGWQILADQTTTIAKLVATQNSDGRLEVFGITPTGDTAHTWQRSANLWQWTGDDLATSPQLNPGLGPNLWLTQHVDNARTGWTPFETSLNVDTVPNAHLLFAQPLDGTAYAQPLYVANVSIPGKGVHNVVYVVTENDTAYAFDADTAQPPLWTAALAPAGETSVSTDDIEGCTNITPVVGVTSTPVIADSIGTLYVVAKTKRLADATFHQYLCALDLTTGASRPNSPVEIWGSCAGVSPRNDGQTYTAFQAQWQLNRPGLLLSKGVVYLAFGAHCDLHPGIYHGWAAGYDAVTLAQVALLCATPNVIQADDSSVQRGGAGIWQAGIGLAADPDGAVYCTTGNGPFDADTGGRNYGDSLLKLGRDLRVVDSFTPSDQGDLVLNDLDLGSGGVLVLPGQPTGSQPADLLLTCGKAGDVFLLNRQGLGGYSGPAGNNSQAVQVVQLQPGRAKETQPGVFGAGAYCRLSVTPDGTGESQFIYLCGTDGPLAAFVLGDGRLSPATVASGDANQSADTYGGGTPVVSSNGTVARSGIVWMIARQNPLRLLAFDATDLSRKLLDVDAGRGTTPVAGLFWSRRSSTARSTWRAMAN